MRSFWLCGLARYCAATSTLDNQPTQEALISIAEQERQSRVTLEAKNEEIQALNEQLRDENLRLAAELEITERIQRMILPSAEELQSITALDIAGYMQPADDVGGDYYDVLQREGTIAMGTATRWLWVGQKIKEMQEATHAFGLAMIWLLLQRFNDLKASFSTKILI